MPCPGNMVGRLLIGAFLLLIAQVASAQFSSVGAPDTAVDTLLKDLTIVVGTSASTDSNLFRHPVLEQSETITTGYVGLRINKTFSQQQIQLGVRKTANRYQKFKYLDFDALDYNGAWNWRVGKQFSGTLSASRTESLAPFEDTIGLGRNVRTTENQAFDTDIWLAGGWHLLAGISQSDQKSEQNVLSRTPDFKSAGANVGVKYLTRAGNSLSFRQQMTDGKYTNAPVGSLNTNYTEDLSEFYVDWKLTGTSALNGSIGWLNRDNDDPTRRDFSGPSSSLSYSWTPSGKLSLNITAARKTSPLQDLAASYKEDTSLSVTPTWRITDKTVAFVRAGYQKSDDRGIVVPLPSGPRQDTTNTASMGVDWAATRSLTVNANLERQKRTSTVATAGYETTIARVSAALSF